jgi:hypothetical protein
MLQLQEVEDRKTPAATTWAAEFLLREGGSRKFLGSWITSGAISVLRRVQRRVPSPNRYMAFAKFCFCKNNKRTMMTMMSKEETSNTGSNVFIPMWEVATHDWSACELRLRAVQKRKPTKARSD